MTLDTSNQSGAHAEATRDRLLRLASLQRREHARASLGLHLGGSAIARLFDIGRPSAVPRTVTLCVVDPLDRHAVRTSSHVSEERLERVSPHLADRDSSTAVVRIGAVTRIAAPRSHVDPCRVFAARTHSVRGLWLQSSDAFGVNVTCKTTTTARGPTQVALKNDDVGTAVTATSPSMLFAGDLDARYRDQATESLSAQIRAAQASATRGVAANKLHTINRDGFSALASAQPKCAASVPRSSSTGRAVFRIADQSCRSEGSCEQSF